MSDAYKTLATMTAHYNGQRYRLERVQLNDLHDWFERHKLRVAGTAQGLTNTWPVLICERRTDDPPATARP